MRASQLQSARSCSKYSPKRINNANMVVATRPLHKSGAFIHGKRHYELVAARNSVTNQASRVPKELISRFVKICPTCQVRRGGSRLTPPNSRRSSPRLEMVPRSPKLPSPPMSRRESSFGGQASLDRVQPDYFSQLHGHSGWLDSHQNLQSRSAVGNGVRSFHGPMSNLSQSISGTLDPFSTDLSVPPSQLSYAAGYVPTHGNSTQREF